MIVVMLLDCSCCLWPARGATIFSQDVTTFPLLLSGGNPSGTYSTDK